MPMINGKPQRARYTSLKLREISSVDNPAQPSATASVVKRMEDPAEAIANITKYVCAEDGAHSFQEVLHENRFSEAIWPFTDALSQSIRSIVGDTDLDGAAREEQIKASVEQFLAAVRDISPTVAKSLEGLISKRESTMAKTAEELQGELTKAQSDLAAAEKARDDAIAAQKMAEDKNKEMAEELDETKKSLAEATDDVIKVDGTEVRKSAVGEATFTVIKAQEARAEKAELHARAEKRFPNLVGSTDAKAAILKAVEGLGEPDSELRKAAEQIMDSAEKMAGAGFARLGSGDIETSPTQKAAVATFEKKVEEIEKRDSVTKSVAMTKARREFPDEFAAYQGAQN